MLFDLASPLLGIYSRETKASTLRAHCSIDRRGACIVPMCVDTYTNTLETKQMPLSRETMCQNFPVGLTAQRPEVNCDLFSQL